MGIGGGGYVDTEIGVNELGRRTTLTDRERNQSVYSQQSNYAVSANDLDVDDLEGALGVGGALYSSGGSIARSSKEFKLYDIADGATVDDIEINRNDLDQVQILSARILELEANEKRLQQSLAMVISQK